MYVNKKISINAITPLGQRTQFVLIQQKGSRPPPLESVETTSSESIVTTYNAPLSDGNEFLVQLKDKYKETIDSNERYRILTTLPKSWSTYRIMKEFNVSQHMANQAKALQQQKGIMSVPVNRLSRASLGEPTIMLVRDFYNSDDISRVCPGKRDYLISKNDEGEIYVQRRLVLCNLQEAYSIFKNTYPDIKIGFSMFASNRPKHCILAGTSGTHTVCVCIYHQNVKLIFKTLQSRQSLPDGVDSYHDLFKKIICQNPTLFKLLRANPQQGREQESFDKAPSPVPPRRD
ncbi:uncharacterized protein LOC135702303 [Ochlerotatus camptorhynchus]|uniref:uncharacterized protein LOC135702303 n=1 Tax=Ochlerotatus camptorhynchus TaxID=644619 RepID=UPI0031D8CF66